MSSLDRALPGWAIDLIRDGVPRQDLKRAGGGAVWGALVKVAITARLRGWGDCELWPLVVDDPRSNLGRQLRIRADGRPVSERSVQRSLDRAWDRACAWQNEVATRDGDVSSAVADRTAALVTLLEDPEADLCDVDRAVLAFAVEEATRRGMTRVTLPRETTANALGLGQKAVRLSLARLVARGLLTLEVPGRAAKDPSNRRASIYGLPPLTELSGSRRIPYMSPEAGPIGPSPDTYRPLANRALGPSPKPIGPSQIGELLRQLSASGDESLIPAIETLLLELRHANTREEAAR